MFALQLVFQSSFHIGKEELQSFITRPVLYSGYWSSRVHHKLYKQTTEALLKAEELQIRRMICITENKQWDMNKKTPPNPSWAYSHQL